MEFKSAAGEDCVAHYIEDTTLFGVGEEHLHLHGLHVARRYRGDPERAVMRNASLVALCFRPLLCNFGVRYRCPLTTVCVTHP